MKEMDRLIAQILRTPAFSNDEAPLLKKLELELKVLYNKTVTLYGESPQEHIAAFQLPYDFPSIFNRPATLEFILTYQYMLIDTIEKSRVYYLIGDINHMDYKNQFINANSSKLQLYIK